MVASLYRSFSAEVVLSLSTVGKDLEASPSRSGRRSGLDLDRCSAVLTERPYRALVLLYMLDMQS